MVQQVETQRQERLREAAALARSVAPRLCAARPRGERCDWYHGFYPALRALGLAADPARHADFFADALAKALAGPARPRVLVTGTGDSGMLETLAAAAAGAGVEPELEALDVCETPLFLCRWWAGRAGLGLVTRRGDVREPRPDAACDLVCCHSFIAKFAPGERGGLYAAWAACLRPGGRVVSTARIDPGQDARAVGFGPGEAAAFRERVRAAAQAAGLDAAALAADAERYAARIASWPVASADELRDGLGRAGFALPHFALVERGAAAHGGGAGTQRRALYAEFVAERL